MSSQSVTERQEDEIQALQAIFMDDATDLRDGDVWKVSRAPEIKLSLRPQESMGGAGRQAYAQVDLVVKCSQNYPNEQSDIHEVNMWKVLCIAEKLLMPPKLSLENSKGLSNNQLAQLLENLNLLTKSLVGEVMIHELAQQVQLFLHENNRPPTMSFYEEMMFNKRKQEEVVAKEHLKKMELQRKKEEKERQSIENEILKKRAALKVETRRWRSLSESNETNSNNSDKSDPSTPSSEPPDCSPIALVTPSLGKGGNRMPDSPLSSRENPLLLNGLNRKQRRTSTPRRTGEEVEGRQKSPPGGVTVLQFSTKGERTVQRGMCLEHKSNGSTVYAGMDTVSGSLVTICEWVLKWKHFASKTGHVDADEDPEAATYMKQIHSIEQEFQTLVRINHPNLINYLAMLYQQDPGKVTVHLLTEHAGGNTVDNYLKRNQPVPMEMLRVYTDELLLAIEYLHNKAVVHKDLRASSVFVDFSGKIRLADFSINKRLSDLYETVEQARPGVHFQDIRPSVIGKGGKKADIFQLGLLVLSLAEGCRIQDIQPVIPATFPVQLHEFLTKCLIQDERLRWSATQLLDHHFLKEPVPGTIHLRPADQDHIHKEIKKPKKNEFEDDDDDLPPFVHATALEATGQSRLTAEFEILKSLGKGGFGDVIKVKNKLDGRYYAIKRIPLNPKSKQFNKKITREVKLLSRLNHENVVRYYNSWIEVSEEPAHSDTSSSYTSKTPESDQKKTPSLSPKHNKDSLDLVDNIEQDAPQAVDHSVDWSVSFLDVACQKAVASDSDDDDDDENDVFGTSFMRVLDNSDSVVFETSTGQAIAPNTTEKRNEKEDGTTDTQDSVVEVALKLQYLYIQMEYCEKSTLRNCIDAGLYQDVTRVWRLFREIIEGLIHIHEQGMIHRDLKPVNIFLDSNDHVKIGDFGLATTDIIAKSGLLDASLPQSTFFDYNISGSSRSGSLGDGNMTGKVGTALYVSPEVMSGGTKLHYDQKVDIYSLGIIFFEMCYKSLPTGMERVQTLSNLRLPIIALPEDFEVEMSNQVHIVKWLLNHDPARRPTSKELLQSDYLPPPQMEEAELNEILRSTISNSKSKAYRRMVDALFSQHVSPTSDISYDMDNIKGSFSLRYSPLLTKVHQSLERVFQLHGATKMTVPFLMPPSDLYKSSEQYVRLMDHGGGLVGLPYDLRVPFARYIARNNIHFLKRYSIERVFREKKVFGLHPKEMTECSFDIVTPTPAGLMPDAEVLVLVQHCIAEFPSLQSRRYYIRINHQSLLKAILLHCCVPEEKHAYILSVLSAVQSNKQKRQKALEGLEGIQMTEQNLATLNSLLDLEGVHGKVASVLRIITKTRGQASTLAKQGLHEVEAALSNATSLGLNMQVVLTLGMIYNHLQYSGIVFQVMRDIHSKKRSAAEVVAAGGRYDKMVQHFMSPMVREIAHATAVGVSIAFDRIVGSVLEETAEAPSPYDILVCTLGCKPMIKERQNVTRDLWAAGLRAQVFYDTVQSIEEISDYCRELGISHLVILKDTGNAAAKVRTLEKEKVTERKVAISEVADFLLQKVLESAEISAGPEKKSQTGISQSYSDQCQTIPSNTSSNITFNCVFIMQEGRISSNTKRKYESQIFAKVPSALPWLPGKSHNVLAMELSKSVLSVIAGYLEVNGTEADFDDSINCIMEKHPRHRKYFSQITDQIYHLKFEKECDVIILYGLKDDSVRLI